MNRYLLPCLVALCACDPEAASPSGPIRPEPTAEATGAEAATAEPSDEASAKAAGEPTAPEPTTAATGEPAPPKPDGSSAFAPSAVPTATSGSGRRGLGGDVSEPCPCRRGLVCCGERCAARCDDG